MEELSANNCYFLRQRISRTWRPGELWVTIRSGCICTTSMETIASARFSWPHHGLCPSSEETRVLPARLLCWRDPQGLGWLGWVSQLWFTQPLCRGKGAQHLQGQPAHGDVAAPQHSGGTSEGRVWNCIVQLHFKELTVIFAWSICVPKMQLFLFTEISFGKL